MATCFSAAAQTTQSSYQPITGSERVQWFTKSTVGPQSLAAGVVSAGWGTLWDRPEEYDTHWEGFGKRYGMRLTGVVSNNAIEASLGAALGGEDPRYTPSDSRNFWKRVGHAGKMTFMAYDRNGDLKPAYARYTANVGSNFLSNTWRVDSESTAGQATYRVGLGFAGRFVGNLFTEFLFNGRR
ncbi:MAG: hypothetical protein H6509_15390 [Bryobacterales bacterium]|nr:hypothetical protein [Acidobacteriota bacterium]MCB9385993.1 hypothetical protein [Bryobacterales bacterium]